MHFGHLRSTLIGNSFSKMLVLKGFNVVCLNHLGDWGLNIGLLIAYMKNLSFKKKNLNIYDLSFFYQKAKFFFLVNNLFRNIVSRETLKLQNNVCESLIFWKNICSISFVYFQKIYNFLKIKILPRGESFYNYMLDMVIVYLKSKNLITISDNAYCVYLSSLVKTDYSLPILVKKTDKTYNYSTTDFAAILYRIFIEKANYVFYITDVGQTLHFKMLFDLSSYLKFTNNNVILEHIPCGFILNENGKKIKTRSGENKDLLLFFTEFVGMGKKIYFENSNNSNILTSTIAFNSNLIKFHELSTHRLSDFIFDINKILTTSKHSFVFILYAFIRIQSILRTFALRYKSFKYSKLRLITIYEYDLCFLINKFSLIFESSLQLYMPHKLVEYLYTLSNCFNLFFEKCKIFYHSNMNARFLLCTSVYNIMLECFFILDLDYSYIL